MLVKMKEFRCDRQNIETIFKETAQQDGSDDLFLPVSKLIKPRFRPRHFEYAACAQIGGIFMHKSGFAGDFLTPFEEITLTSPFP